MTAPINNKLLGGNRNLIHDEKTKNPQIQPLTNEVNKTSQTTRKETNFSSKPNNKLLKQQGKRPTSLPTKNSQIKEETNYSSKQISTSIKGPTSLQPGPTTKEGTNFPPDGPSYCCHLFFAGGCLGWSRAERPSVS